MDVISDKVNGRRKYMSEEAKEETSLGGHAVFVGILTLIAIGAVWVLVNILSFIAWGFGLEGRISNIESEQKHYNGILMEMQWEKADWRPVSVPDDVIRLK